MLYYFKSIADNFISFERRLFACLFKKKDFLGYILCGHMNPLDPCMYLIIILLSVYSSCDNKRQHGRNPLSATVMRNYFARRNLIQALFRKLSVGFLKVVAVGMYICYILKSL